MKIHKLIILILIILQNVISFTAVVAFGSEIKTDSSTPLESCLEIAPKTTLKSAWRHQKPYQFEETSTDLKRLTKLTGLDITLINMIASKVGISVTYEPVAWTQQQLDIKDGVRDLAYGATYSDERAQYSYFSVPYRFEENSLFILRNSKITLKFTNIEEYLAQTRLQNFRLGIIKGYVYVDPKINEFINDKLNNDIIFPYEEGQQALEALISKEIDGFIDDKIAGYAVILDKTFETPIAEISLGIQRPIHLMFSKKTVPIDLVDHFNQVIKKFVETEDYKKITKYYLAPVMLLQLISSELFYTISIIGTIAFAISGIVLAVNANSTLFGTFILSALPSIGGIIIRDMVITKNNVLNTILNPIYIYYILAIVLMGFATIRLLNYYNREAGQDNWVQKFWDILFVICDSLGQATFIVIGVSIAFMAQIEPIPLWGPIFAFIVANGGSLLRDLLIKEKFRQMLTARELNSEISILWGFVLSILLNIYAYTNNFTILKYIIFITIGGAFLSRLFVYYFKIPNLRFSKEEENPTYTK